MELDRPEDALEDAVVALGRWIEHLDGQGAHPLDVSLFDDIREALKQQLLFWKLKRIYRMDMELRGAVRVDEAEGSGAGECGARAAICGGSSHVLTRAHDEGPKLRKHLTPSESLRMLGRSCTT